MIVVQIQLKTNTNHQNNRNLILHHCTYSHVDGHLLEKCEKNIIEK